MVADFRILRRHHRAVRFRRSGAHGVEIVPAFIACSQLAWQRVRDRVRIRLTVAFAAWESFHL